MGKAIATIGTGPMRSVLARSLPTFIDYGSRHGYAVVVGDGDAEGRPASWGKVKLIRSLLDAFDTVVWIDADAIVVDPNVDIETMVGAHDYQAMLVYEWDDNRIPNLGVWMVRSCDRARAFLDAVWALDKYTLHRWWENAAVMDLLGYTTGFPVKQVQESKWSEGVAVLGNEWNSYVPHEGIRTDARIRHYAGMSNRLRRTLMSLDRIPVVGEPALRGVYRGRAVSGRLRRR